jgi:predicted O-methyltransferase YrrM
MIDGVKNALRPPLALIAALKIKAFGRGRPGHAASVSFMQRHRGRGDCAIEILQKESEIERLCELVATARPRSMLEIGTAGGGTLFLFCAAAADDATLVTVDLPPPGGYRRHRGRIYRAFARGRQRVHALRADSQSSATLDLVRDRLGGPVDFLFIDGDHSAAGVERDYELYGPLVRPGGLIAFHDIVPGPEDSVGGVPDFWARLKSDRQGDVDELVEDWSQGGYGIGVVRVR